MKKRFKPQTSPHIHICPKCKKETVFLKCCGQLTVRKDTLPVYAIDRSHDTLVKLVKKNHNNRWMALRLKSVRQVEVNGEMHYSFEWETKQSEEYFGKYYYTFAPFEEKDVARKVTSEMVEFVKRMASYAVSWCSPTRATSVPEGFVTVKDAKNQVN